MKREFSHVCPDCGGWKSNGYAKVCIKCVGKYRERPENYFICICQYCGKEFKGHIGDIKRGGAKFCSMECRLKVKIPHPAKRNRIEFNCETCGKTIYRTPSEIQKNVTGIYFCSQSCWKKHNFGENHPNFNPNKHKDSRKTLENIQWRNSIYERDNYTCQTCGEYGGRISAHHIKRWVTHPELRYVISNGITLCEKCHKNVRGKEVKYEKFFMALVEENKWYR